jgi:hypothetical protein
MGIFAQEKIYSDDKLSIQMSLESIQDQKNDVFYEYYALEITNISDKKISFTPVFNYKTDKGEVKSSTSHDGVHLITLAPGESLKGDIENQAILTLFKEFLEGNNGKKASSDIHSLESVTVKY